jgi:hypothetical protein
VKPWQVWVVRVLKKSLRLPGREFHGELVLYHPRTLLPLNHVADECPATWPVAEVTGANSLWYFLRLAKPCAEFLPDPLGIGKKRKPGQLFVHGKSNLGLKVWYGH